VIALALAALTLAAPPRFAHAVVIVLENRDRSAITASSAPALVSLGNRYARLTRYRGVAHPSLPNYLALVSGSTHGITSDCTTCSSTGSTIGDELDAAGLTWAAYAEGYPSSLRFAKKHEPFLYFRQDAARVKPLSAFDPAHLPAFALVTPDLCHDMHDCSTATGDRWLKRFVTPLLRVPETVVFVVFDEGAHGNDVAAFALGTAVRPGSSFALATDHYGLLRTLEEAWDLPPLGHAATARPITGIWK
jgi:hypothetical protein